MAIPFLSAIGLGLRKAGQVLTGTAAKTARSTVQAAKTALSGIRGGVARGLGDSAIGRALRGAGVNVPAPTLTKVVTRERRRREASAKLKFLPKNRKPNPARLPLSLTPIARNYSFLVEVSGIDKTTGEAVQKWITISTNELMDRDKLEEAASQMFGRDPDAYAVDSPSFTLVEGMRAQNAPALTPEE